MFAQVLRLADQLSPFESLLDQQQYLLRLKRFFNEEERPGFRRFDSFRNGAVAGDNDHLGLRREGLDRAQEREPAVMVVGQLKICQHKVVGLLLDRNSPCAQIGCRIDLKPFRPKQVPQTISDRGLIINHQDFDFSLQMSISQMGNITRTSVPSVDAASATTSPP
jgi:hypothetical protein